MPDTASLRERLRADTRADHQQLDDAFSTLALGQPEQLTVFLAAQAAALARLGCLAGPRQAEAEALRDEMLSALTRDLSHLQAPAPTLPPPVTAEADAVLYILLGSRLGTQVLARQWTATATGAARGAGAYFGLDPRKTDWRAFCQRLGGEPADSLRAGRLLRDCRSLFQHFGAALRLNRPDPAAQAEVLLHG